MSPRSPSTVICKMSLGGGLLLLTAWAVWAINGEQAAPTKVRTETTTVSFNLKNAILFKVNTSFKII